MASNAAARDSGAADRQRDFICRIVDAAAAANHLPAAFLTRILWQESHFRTDATSPAGAQGVAQFMPQTAAEHGLADPRVASAAIAEAAGLLADLAARFGNLGLAAAAYNAGAGRVAKWLQAKADLPAETRRYVVAVTGRPAEEWASRPGWPAAADGGPCLRVAASFRSQPTWSPGSPAELRLYRALARAGRLLAALSRVRDDREAPPRRAAIRLCEALRARGARCAVYY